MKKAISILLVLCCTVLSLNIAIAEENNGKDYYVENERYEQRGDFIYYPDTNQIRAYVGEEDSDIVIPEGSDITKMGVLWQGPRKVNSITISNNVEYEQIPLKANTIIFADGIKEIPDKAFKYSELKKVVFPQTLETIGSEAFLESELSGDIVLPDSLKTIGEKAFCGTKITSVTMSDNVTYIDDYAFSDCGKLKNAHLSNNLIKFGKDIFFASPLQKLNIPDNWDVTQADCGSFGTPSRFSDVDIDYEINREMTVDLYKKFGSQKYLKKYCTSPKLKNYPDGDDWWVIGDVVVGYSGNSLKPEIPDFIREVYSLSVNHDGMCETVIIPPSVKKLDENCFAVFYMEYLNVPDTVEEIGDGFVAGAQVTDLTINGSPKISADMLRGCNFLMESGLHIDPQCKIPSNFNTEYLATEQWWIDDPAYIEQMEKYKARKEGKPVQSPIVTVKPSDMPEPTLKPTETAKPTIEPITTPVPEVLTVESGDEITVKVNDKTVMFPDAKPFLDDNGRTQVPVRAVSEMLNAKVDWQQDSATAVITKDNGDTVKIKLNSNVMTINEKSVQMDTAATLKDDRTFIPVRFVAEALGLTVNWVE